MNVFKLALANMRKRKGASITFLVMVFLSALMLTTALSLVTGISNFFERKVDELNAPHFTAIIRSESYRPEFYDWAVAHQNTTDVAAVDSRIGIGMWQTSSGVLNITVAFIGYQHNLDNSFYTPPIIDRRPTMLPNSIVLPISLRANGFRAGQNITLTVNEQDYQFNIFGFFENAISGASTGNIDIVFVNDAFINQIAVDDNFTFDVFLIARLQNTSQAASFENDFVRFSQLNDNEFFVVSFEMAKLAATMFINIMAMILMIFAVIILVIAFIVVGFSITTSIAEDRATIGVMKGIGYKSGRLRSGLLIQYLMVTFVGALVGAAVALLTFGFLGNIIASTSGLLWLNDSNIGPFFISIFVILGLTALITYLVTFRYKSVTPIDALRPSGGVKKGKRNPMPLDSGRMPLTLHLGLKRFLGSIRNNVILTVVIMLLVFVSIIVNVLNFNLNVDRTAMINMVGLEMSELYVQASPGIDVHLINAEINSHAEVNRTMLFGTRFGFINDYITNVETMEDFSALTMNTVIRGRNPVNTAGMPEIALGVLTARTAGVDIGGTVEIEIHGTTVSYRIVGLTQSIANAGLGARITHEAMVAHVPTFDFSLIFVYLHPNVNVAAYMTHLTSIFGNDILMMDTEETMDTILNSIGGPVETLLYIMMIVNVFIIAFVIYLMLSTIIRKARKEFGILKAIGYRNTQLVLQLLLSLLPSFILGAVLGMVLGFTLGNPVLGVFFSGAGLLRATFIIPGFTTVLITFGILALSILVTYLIALRLRKISPQKLIVE